MVLASISLNTTFSIKSPMMMIESNPANTSGMLSWFFASKMYQPNPPCPDVVPKTNSAAINVRQAKAQPIFRPASMLGNAAGIRISSRS